MNGITATEGTFSGELRGATGTFSGELQAAGGTFSGNLDAASGTFKGELQAATGSFSGNLDAASGTFGIITQRTTIGEGAYVITIKGDGIHFSGDVDESGNIVDSSDVNCYTITRPTYIRTKRLFCTRLDCDNYVEQYTILDGSFKYYI